MKELKVLLAGGGSGGHIFPLIAVAQELKKHADEVGLALDMRYYGDAYNYANEIVESGMDFEPIISSKLRHYYSLLNVIDGFKFILSIPQALWKIFWFMPDVVFSKGGPGALAVVLVSKFYMIPVVIHESDSIPGLTNKISGSMAKKIFLAFSSAKEFFKDKDIEIIGNPVRQTLLAQMASLGSSEKEAKEKVKKGFGLDPQTPPILLILGGSQGAERLNSFILEYLKEWLGSYQILHQVGARNYDSYKQEFEFISKEWSDELKNRYIFKPFFDKDLSDALIAADLIVARAGAGTIFEIAAFGKPSVLIPFPDASNNHQLENARFYSQSGAAIVIQQENLLGGLFMDEVNKLINNQASMKQMSEAAKIFYRPDAATIIAKHLLTYVS